MDLTRSTQWRRACRDLPHDGLPSCVKSLARRSTYRLNRFQDHWHDVTIGSILGLTVAYFSYRQYYPDLADEFSHRPFSPRIRDEDSNFALPIHDQSKNQRYDPPVDPRVHDSFELGGTVQRPGPQHLRDAWREHEDSSARENIVRPDHDV